MKRGRPWSTVIALPLLLGGCAHGVEVDLRPSAGTGGHGVSTGTGGGYAGNAGASSVAAGGADTAAGTGATGGGGTSVDADAGQGGSNSGPGGAGGAGGSGGSGMGGGKMSDVDAGARDSSPGVDTGDRKSVV